MPLRLLALIALALPQSTPTGGAIGKLVPPIPTPSSFISDERKVLTPAGHQELDGLIRAIQAAGRGDIAVAIIPSIGDYSASQVGVEIYRTWKVGAQAQIGSARRHLGVLILIVPKEFSPNNRGECWITTGLGAEAMITDAFAASVCRDQMIPRLREGNFAAAVRDGIDAIERRLTLDPVLAAAADSALANPQRAFRPPSNGPSGITVVMIVGAVLTFLITLIALMRRAWRRRPRKCMKCGRMMTRLDEGADDAHLAKGQRIEEEVGSVDYDVWQCACGHFVVIPWKKWFTEYAKCRECNHITAKSKRRVISPATRSSSGSAEDRYKCRHCGAAWVELVVLPQITESRSSSGGSSGGGGSSFGGSGSSSGGGGGSSY